VALSLRLEVLYIVTLADVKNNPAFESLIKQGDAHLEAIGFTEHGNRHAGLVSNISRNILTRLGYDQRRAELAAIAGYLHDIGNVVTRHDHGQTSALIVGNLLAQMGMDYSEIGIVMGAIGNHEEEYGEPVSEVSAAVILADKSDVHRSRVRNRDLATFDIHDRVNYAVVHSFLNADDVKRDITLNLTIDNEICPVMEYFEIFLVRMMMCRRAAAFLNAVFRIEINGTKIL
jgi:metal-dependent HD superfamily phosphatase/phosphodiesterase